MTLESAKKCLDDLKAGKVDFDPSKIVGVSDHDAAMKHIHGNWRGKIPEVYRWPYDYSKPGYKEDFVPQHIPLKKGEEEY